MRTCFAVFVVFIAICLGQTSLAYNATGHKIIASVCYRQLSDAERAALIEVLKQHPRFSEDFENVMPDDIRQGGAEKQNEWLFQQAAVWPDLVKSGPPARRAFSRPSWHYVNVPHYLTDEDRDALKDNVNVNLDADPPEDDIDDAKMNVVQAIKNSLRVLQGDEHEDAVKAIHLCWMLHLTGDLHQPLHATALFSQRLFPHSDKGGNGVKTQPLKNLHAAWDGAFGSSTSFTNCRNLANELVSRSDFERVRDDALASDDPEAWRDESYEAAKEHAYNHEVMVQLEDRDENDNDIDHNPIQLPETYLRNRRTVANRLAVLAGVRCAQTLSAVAVSAPAPEVSAAARSRSRPNEGARRGAEPRGAEREQTSIPPSSGLKELNEKLDRIIEQLEKLNTEPRATVPFGETSPGASTSSHRFPDFAAAFAPARAEYGGSLFQLSQDYPAERPEIDEALRKILAIPFNENEGQENWKQYLLAVRDYCFDGNLEVNWRGQSNMVRSWYHVPWQHYGDKGREGINGLTREATAKEKQLAPTQTSRHQTHAVALYNPIGGYTIGKVWQNQFEPDPSQAIFPVGTVVAKVLFTQADEKEVPYLSNPVEWDAFIDNPTAGHRTVQKLRLLQMDIMVRDERANATGGWIFGTYCYNGKLASENPWHNLVPVGIQWGNDPDVTAVADNPENPEATETKINPKLRETIINDSADLPPQHLGWGGRLNGPADNYRSSCASCHSTAQYPVVAPQHPDFEKLGYKPGDADWNTWFRNLDCGQAFNPRLSSDTLRAVSTDFSLQLSIGIDQFYKWKQGVMAGHFTPVLPGEAADSKRVQTFTPSSEPALTP